MHTDHVASTPTLWLIVSTIPIFLSDFNTVFHVKMQKLPYLDIFIIHSSNCILVPFCYSPFWCTVDILTMHTYSGNAQIS